MRLSAKKTGPVYRMVRLAAASTVFALFAAGMTADTATGRPDSVVETAAEYLARLQLVPALLRLSAVVLLLTTAATLLFGRVYCAGLCPLGTLQDILRGAARRISYRRARYRPPAPLIRFGILAAAAAALLFGSSSVLGLTDPYSIFSRMMHDSLKPARDAVISAAAVPLKVFGVYIWPPGGGANAIMLYSGFAVLALLVAAAFFRGRPFCSLLCPAGTMLSLLSRKPAVRIEIDGGACTVCGACERICPAECVDARAGVIDQGDCVRCGNCLTVCPVSAIHLSLPGRPEPAERPDDPGVSRRSFLRSSASAVGGIGAFLLVPRKTAAADRPVPPVFFHPRKLETPVEIEGSIRESLAAAVPPGSGGTKRFGSRCVACRLCESRCPTGVLRAAFFTRGLAGILQPSMDYETGFCEYSCTVCGQVCPTGAILPLDLRTKQTTQIGRAHLLKDRCVIYTRETACGACAEVCPTHAVHMIPYKPFLNQPETDESLCIGCGNCQFACPVPGTKAILVEGRTEHKAVDDRKDRPPRGTPVPDPSESGEFPF